MKRRILSTTLAVAVLALSATSCKRNIVDAAETEIVTDVAETQARSEYIDQDATDVVEESAARMGVFGGNGCNPNFGNLAGSCAVVTTTGTFPTKNISIDFGTGCTSPKGIVRKGIINIVLTDSLQNPGSLATITFSNYYINGFKRDGTITRTNTTVAGGTTRSWNRTVVNGSMTSPAGQVRTFSKNINITQIDGLSTPCDRSDDIYLLDGTRTVTSFNGKTRTFTTQTPLQKKASCANIDQGILNIQAGTKTATLDFGTGNCDNQAVLTIPGKSPKTITLK
jgi:hypothetical protein